MADKRAPTPSAAAELVVPNEIEIFFNLANFKNKLHKYMLNIVEGYRQQINYILNRPIFKKPFGFIEEQKQLLDEKGTQIKQIVVNKIEILKRELKIFDGKINTLSPLSILNRGYSVTMKNDKIVLSIKNIKQGDVIHTIVKDGKIKSEVQDKDGK